MGADQLIGLRREKRKDLNALKISGHLKFEDASGHPLAKKFTGVYLIQITLAKIRGVRNDESDFRAMMQ